MTSSEEVDTLKDLLISGYNFCLCLGGYFRVLAVQSDVSRSLYRPIQTQFPVTNSLTTQVLLKQSPSTSQSLDARWSITRRLRVEDDFLWTFLHYRLINTSGKNQRRIYCKRERLDISLKFTSIIEAWYSRNGRIFKSIIEEFVYT